MYLGKQVHPFGKTGACIWVIRCTRSPAPSLRRICNPTASSISICNALINNQETKNIFTHLKCLYSLRLDCKSNRAREIQPSKGHPLRRICNPTASSISICNALINNQETKNIFTHLKCLYSLRLDCKSNRARDIQPSKVIRCTHFCDSKEQKEQKKTRKSFLRTCAYTYAGKISKKLLLLLLQCY